MRSALALPLLLTIPLITCCATTRYEDMRHRAENAEAELIRAQMFIAGAHDDNAMLQKALIEQENALRALAGGMVIQADETAKLREACDI